jgi:hypothetical protein
MRSPSGWVGAEPGRVAALTPARQQWLVADRRANALDWDWLSPGESQGHLIAMRLEVGPQTPEGYRDCGPAFFGLRDRLHHDDVAEGSLVLVLSIVDLTTGTGDDVGSPQQWFL